MIEKAALLFFRVNGQTKELLMVRAQGKGFFIFPGGKQEPRETLEQALARELREELSADVENIKKLGDVSGVTPDGRLLHEHFFSGNLTSAPVATSEIAEIRWVSRSDITDNKVTTTPLTIDHALPFMDKLQLWELA